MSRQEIQGKYRITDWLRIVWWSWRKRSDYRTRKGHLDDIAAYVGRLLKVDSLGGMLFLGPWQGKGFTVERELSQLMIRVQIPLTPSGRKPALPFGALPWFLRLHMAIPALRFWRRRNLPPPAAEPEKEQAIRRWFTALNIAPDQDTVRDTPEYTDAIRVLRYPIGNQAKQATAIIQRLLREVYEVQETDELGFLFLDYSQLPYTAETEQECRQAIAAVPNDAQAYERLGNLTLARQRYAEAETAYKQALALAPGNTQAHSGLAYIYLDQQRYAEAEEACNQALAIDPEDVFTHGMLAHVYFHLQRYARAEKECRRVLATDPNDRDTLELLAYLYCHQRRYVAAEQEYQRLLALDPDDTEARLGLGNVYYEWQQYAKAEREYRRVLALDPRHSAARNNLKYLARIEEEWKQKQQGRGSHPA
jgi:tetratricopeptide (TPR) repeat protein